MLESIEVKKTNFYLKMFFYSIYIIYTTRDRKIHLTFTYSKSTIKNEENTRTWYKIYIQIQSVSIEFQQVNGKTFNVICDIKVPNMSYKLFKVINEWL